jgi:hypothetical protein
MLTLNPKPCLFSSPPFTPPARPTAAEHRSEQTVVQQVVDEALKALMGGKPAKVRRVHGVTEGRACMGRRKGK